MIKILFSWKVEGCPVGRVFNESINTNMILSSRNDFELEDKGCKL